MDALKIAEAKARHFEMLCNSRCYTANDTSYESSLVREEMEYFSFETMISELALSRAAETNRDFHRVWIEVELEVMFEFGRLLAKAEEYPVFAGSKRVVVEEEGLNCGVCLEEMDKGKEGRQLHCLHNFHASCIDQWTIFKSSCPLCRFNLPRRDSTS